MDKTSATDLGVIRERHGANPFPNGMPSCRWCHTSGECDTQLLLAAYDALELEQDYRDLFAEIQEEREETTRIMIGWQHKAETAERERDALIARVAELLRVDVTALAYVSAINKEVTPDGCEDWSLAEEITLEALHAALGLRNGT